MKCIPPRPESGPNVSLIGASSSGARYAILFRTHTVDAFILRQFQRLASQMQHGDIYMVANNTKRDLRPPNEVAWFEFSEVDCEPLGLVKAGRHELFWFNVDYPLYMFFNAFPCYDYYLLCEYDVVINVSLDDIVSQAVSRNCDFISFKDNQPDHLWDFIDTCHGVYDIRTVKKRLMPFALFSNKAVKFLFDRRKELAIAFKAGDIPNWPHCELFVPTELSRSQFKEEDLSLYGSTQHYDYLPAYEESQLDQLSTTEFVHPVLDQLRIVLSIIKYEKRPELFFWPTSRFSRVVRQLPVSTYARPLFRVLAKRFRLYPLMIAHRLVPVWKRFTGVFA